MEELKAEILNFREARNWQQFHTPENLAKSISIEAAEILEHFQWDNEFKTEALAEEIADVYMYLTLLAEAIGVDMKEIVRKKIKQNEIKYPVEKARNSSKKYTEYQ